MFFEDWINIDPEKGRIRCGSCNNFRAIKRKQLGSIIGICPYTKAPTKKASDLCCKKHYEPNFQNGVIIHEKFVDECRWGTGYGLDKEDSDG